MADVEKKGTNTNPADPPMAIEKKDSDVNAIK